jgi:hypothetical protein
MCEMLKFIAGLVVGLFAGYLLGLVVPVRFFLIAILALMVLAILLFFLFHLGVQDFQEY